MRTRPVGLGITGFGDLCLATGVKYGAPASLALMREVMGFVRREAWLESLRLGSLRGAFPEFARNRAAYEELVYADLQIARRTPLTPRNFQVSMIEPAGTVSQVAETSFGCEPNFSWVWMRHDRIGRRTCVHPMAAQALGLEVDWMDPAAVDRAADVVLRREGDLPEHFVCALDVPARDHVRLLAAAQEHVDNSVSKTVNGTADDSVQSVIALYGLARELDCKAVSYYRDGSRDGQVMNMVRNEAPTACHAGVCA